MQKNEVDEEQSESASESEPNASNPDIVFNTKTGTLAVDLDAGEWVIIALTLAFLLYTGLIVL